MSFNVQKIDNSYKIHYRNSKFYPISLTDPDALRYIAKVQQADGTLLEPAIRNAITDFVIGCKSDGIWNAIKSCCILMGARTLAGALTPLVGVAPINNVPFVSGDYDRKIGLIGDGVGKYLDTSRNVNADPQNSQHMAVYASSIQNVVDKAFMGAGAASTGSTQFAAAGDSGAALRRCGFRSRTTSQSLMTNYANAGFIGQSRSSSVNYTVYNNGTSSLQGVTSQTPHNGNILVFARNNASNVAGLFASHRLAFYSVGESISLSLLDNRVTNLYNSIGIIL
jgi:hypothetical protein